MNREKDTREAGETLVHRSGKGARFYVGIVLLAINIPVGWLGVALGGWLVATGRAPLGAWVGGGTYALSWVMLGTGAFLSGKEGVAYSRQLWTRFCGKKSGAC
jgi:hypothetical protein